MKQHFQSCVAGLSGFREHNIVHFRSVAVGLLRLFFELHIMRTESPSNESREEKQKQKMGSAYSQNTIQRRK